MCIKASDNGQDIGHFIYYEVDPAIKERRLLNGKVSEFLQERIISTLINGSKGCSAGSVYRFRIFVILNE